MLATRGPGVHLRLASEADAEAVLALVGALGRPADPGDRAQLAAAAAIVAHPESPVILAEVAGTGIGVCCLQLLPRLGWATPEARLLDLYVAEAARGSGVGRRLVTAGAALAQERGCHVLRLECGHARVASHAFYEHLGFEDRGRDYQLALQPRAGRR
jgi:GNAT superfamily N-acetyltransferase